MGNDAVVREHRVAAKQVDANERNHLGAHRLVAAKPRAHGTHRLRTPQKRHAVVRTNASGEVDGHHVPRVLGVQLRVRLQA